MRPWLVVALFAFSCSHDLGALMGRGGGGGSGGFGGSISAGGETGEPGGRGAGGRGAGGLAGVLARVRLLASVAPRHLAARQHRVGRVWVASPPGAEPEHIWGRAERLGPAERWESAVEEARAVVLSPAALAAEAG